MAEFEFAIAQRLGMLSAGAKGWNKELNLVSWNKREPKLDIREWDEAHEKMGKGVTLTKEEAEKLYALLGEWLKTAK